MQADELELYKHYVQNNLPTKMSKGSAQRTSIQELATHYDGFLFDGFGTLYNLTVAHPGAALMLQGLRANHKKIRLVTNAASRHPSQLISHLQVLGFDLQEHEVICSGSLLWQANSQFKIQEALHIGRTDALCFLEAAGIQVSTTPREASVILSSSPKDWNHESIAQAEQVLRRPQARLVVLNPDAYAPAIDGSRYPVSGMLAWQLQKKAGCHLFCLGKPFGEIFAQALASMDLEPKRCIMVGDTLGTDIAGAQAAGIDTALILGGNSSEESVADDEAALGVSPNYYLPSTY